MSVGPAPACPGGTLHTIRPGDTLFALAEGQVEFGVKRGRKVVNVVPEQV